MGAQHPVAFVGFGAHPGNNGPVAHHKVLAGCSCAAPGVLLAQLGEAGGGEAAGSLGRRVEGGGRGGDEGG